MALSKYAVPIGQQEQLISAFRVLEALIAAVNQSLDLDTILNETLGEIMELFQCHSTHIRLIDFTTNELFIAAHRGYSTADLAQLTKRRKYGEGLSAVSIESGEVLIIEDINTDPRYGTRNGFARRIGVRSFIYFPLRAKGKMLGDIVVHYEKLRPFSPEEVQLFVAIGHLIGAAIENARSYGEKMQEIAERRQVEQKLKLQEIQVRTILESTGDGILAVDNAGKVIKTNQRFSDLWKIPTDLLKTGSDETLLTYVLSQVADPDAFLKKVHTLYASAGVSFDTILFKDGRIIERYSCPMLNDGVINGRVWSFRDITESKQAEEALLSREAVASRLAKENEVIAEIGRIISSSLNIDEVYERFAAEVRKLISIDRITINIVNPRDNTATTAYASGTGLLHRKKGFIYPLAFTFTEEVRRTRKSLFINEDNYKDYSERFPGLAHNFQAGFRSLMVVPLLSKDEVIGALQFRHTKSSTYSEKDLKLAERMGFQISEAIANAQLFLERKEAEEKYYDLYDNAPDMYYTVDSTTGVIQECNETFSRKTGYSKEELIGRPIFELYDSDSAEDSKKSLQQFPLTGEVHDAERQVKCKDGHIINVSLNVSAIRDKDGNIIYSRAIWRDITKRKEYEEMIRALSITDQLTGLYNRRGFMTLAEQQLRVAERTKNGLFLLYADLDGLKQINDKLGHKSGDEAIVEAANVLKEVFRKMDIIARMGGDEFAVLAPEASLEYADMIKHRLQAQLDIHNSQVDRDYNLSLSIGMVYHDPSSSSSLDELISRADSLMYEQKRLKKSFA